MSGLLSTAQVGRLLGVSKTYVLELVWSRMLVPVQTLRVGKNRFNRYRFSRESVAAWLVRNGTDPRLVRAQLAPGKVLVLVRCEAALQSALAACPTTGVPSFFHLGRAVATESCWGVVVDLPHTGTPDAVNALYGFAQERARPELVGLHGDDLDPQMRGLLAETFDVLLPKARGPQRLAREILALDPSRRGRVDAGGPA